MDDDIASIDSSLLSFDSYMPSDDDSTTTSAVPAHDSQSPTHAKVITERKVKAVQTWSFSRKPSSTEPTHDTKGHRIWYCKYKQCSNYRAISTTNARAHLRKIHGITILEAQSIVKRATAERLKGLFERQGLQAEDIRKKSQERALTEVLNKQLFLDALVQLICVRNLPYNCVEWPELRALLLTVNQACEHLFIDSHSTVPKLIHNAFVQDKGLLKERLQRALSKIHFSVDCWSSPNRKNFQAICSHFVDESGILRKALLALPYHPNGHGGEFQAIEFSKVVDDFDIADQIGYFVSDNATSNDKMLRYISNGLQERGIRSFKPNQRRIRCHGHIVNIAVQAFLFLIDEEAVEAALATAQQVFESGGDTDIEDHMAERFNEASEDIWRQIGPLGKLHNFAVWLRKSNNRYNEFHSRAKKMLTLDNDTRWNSWYTMLELAIRLKQYINEMYEAHYNELEDDFISPSDWRLLQEIRDFLQPFYRVTMETQGDFATLDRTLYTMDFLVKHYKKAEVGTLLLLWLG